MINVRFVEPNYSCKVTDRDGRVVDEVHHALSKEELEERLRARVADGLITAFADVGPYDFNEWKRRAQKEKEEMFRAYSANKPYKFNPRIWSLLKEHLKTLFNGKCAYCEARFSHVSPGDVEHMRPKGEVTDADGQPVYCRSNRKHPGYWWRAYEISNLVLSCEPCNRPPGKGTRFPIAGVRACGPRKRPEDCEADLRAECALLLDPYDHTRNPRAHIRFFTETEGPLSGGATPWKESPFGDQTIKLLNLNRRDLLDERRLLQRQAHISVRLAIDAIRNVYDTGVQLDPNVESGLKMLPFKVREKYSASSQAFSAAALDEIDAVLGTVPAERV